jgi:hypothetical protein
MLQSLIQSIMKRKLLFIATIFIFTAVASHNARAQWECVGGPRSMNCFANNGENLFATSWGSGIFRSTDSGATWILIDSSLGDLTFRSLATFAGSIFAGSSDYHGVFRSSDNGISWESDTSDMDSNIFVDNIAVFGNTLFIWGDWRGNTPISRSTDTGRTWVPSSTQGMSFGMTRGGGVFGVNGTNLFAGGTGVYLSTDNGETWNDRSNGLGGTPVSFATIGTYLFAGSSGGVFRSSDSGGSWEAASNGIDDIDILSLATSGSNIFAVSPARIYLSTDSGNSWASVTPLGSILGGFNYVYAADGYLFAGSSVDSVWRRPLSDFNNSAVSPATSINNSLTTYPNPFTDKTTITISPSESGVAEISVVNLLGEEVARIFNGELSAGEHSFLWDKPTGLTAGMYECIVRMNGTSQELPLMLER